MWHCPLGATADPRSWMGPLPPLSLSDEHITEVGGRVEAPHIQVTQRESEGVTLFRERWRDDGGPHPGL